MDNIDRRFETLGIKIPEILLPGDNVDLKKWAVVACDQFTAQPEYWQEVEEFVGDSPSALRLILPEAYLEETDIGRRADEIRHSMEQYLHNNILESKGLGFVFIKRKIPGVPTRRGLVVAIDLEQYEYSQKANSLIRPTEGTVVDRLPPRVKIRSMACLELPHIIVLIDDDQRCVIEPLESNTAHMKKLYDFELMKGGGSVSGYLINNKEILEQIACGLETLSCPDVLSRKYNENISENILLYAVGDGNHSLAAAKVHWENLKKSNPEINMQHPARYALVELVNIHDEGVIFEPIHRVVFNVDPRHLLESLIEWFRNRGVARCRLFNNENLLDDFIKTNPPSDASHFIRFICNEGHGCISVDEPQHQLAVGTLQVFLDHYLKNNPTAKIDYIHGDDVVESLGCNPNNIGFLLPPMHKSDLFKTVIRDGVLPRKTFSMGEAPGKRYYIEARKIR
jgi:uncharacterized protein (DUF1015 family)